MYSKAQNTLYTQFFSSSNMNVIQRDIRANVYNFSGVEVSDQDMLDLFNIMQSVYSVNSFNPNGNISSQIDWMNKIVVRKCSSQIITGLHIYKRYIYDISNPIRPSNLPRYTSTYGNKIPVNVKL